MLAKLDKRARLWTAFAASMLVLAVGLVVASNATAGPTIRNKALANWPGRPVGGPMLVGHVTWQTIPQPNSRSVQPITITLTMGPTEINYPAQSTDVSGFFTVPVSGLANGIYNWRAKGPKYLANIGTVTLTGAPTTQVELG